MNQLKFFMETHFEKLKHYVRNNPLKILEAVICVIAVVIVSVIGSLMLEQERSAQFEIMYPEFEYIAAPSSDSLEAYQKKPLYLNLNTASKEELMLLESIGEKKAERIIEYRENKPFETIEELMNVSGIGEKTFEKLKEFIYVE